MRILFIFLLLNIPIKMALAIPVYLVCEAKDKNEVVYSFDVALDEQNRKITYTNNRAGKTYNTEGFFSANEISFKDVFDSLITTNYTIDRTNLSFTIEHVIGEERIIKTGSCQVIKVADRKI